MKKQSRKLLVVGIVFLLMAGACVTPAPPPTMTPIPPPATPTLPNPTAIPSLTPAPTPTLSPIDLALAYGDTLNQKNADSFLALFPDSIGWYGNTIKKEALRNTIEAGFETNTKYSFSNCRVDGEKVTCTVIEASDCVPVDLVGSYYEKTFRIVDGKIAYASVTWDSSEPHNAAIVKLGIERDKWASENLPDDYAKVNDGKEALKFIGSGDQGSGKLTASEFGQAWERICLGYAEATK